MFIGEYSHNLDSKNRIIIPSKFREELGTTFIVTKGFDGCLACYTLEKWASIYEQLKKLPATKRETRLYIHTITSRATECVLDCSIVGVSDYVEIWDKATWDKYYDEANSSFEKVAEELTDFLV